MFHNNLSVAPPQLSEDVNRYKRCIFDDMKTAIDLLKVFNDALKELHPEVFYKIKQLL